MINNRQQQNSNVNYYQTNSFETRESTAYHNNFNKTMNVEGEDSMGNEQINSMTRLENMLKRNPLDVL